MIWFKHSATALNDAKILKLIAKHGMEGYGIYFAIIEILAHELTPNKMDCILEHDIQTLASLFRKEEDDMQTLADNFISYNLFTKTPDGKLQCLKLLDRLDNTAVKNPKIKGIREKWKLSSEMNTSSSVTPPRRDEKRREEMREEEKRRDEIRRDETAEEEDGYSDFINYWNINFACFNNISNLEFMTEPRMNNLSEAIHLGLNLEKVLEKTLLSDFLTEQHHWSFDWLLSKDKSGILNWMKIQEGKYTDRTLAIGTKKEKVIIPLEQEFPGYDKGLHDIMRVILAKISEIGKPRPKDDEIMANYNALITVQLLSGEDWESIGGYVKSLTTSDPECFPDIKKLSENIMVASSEK